MNRVKTLTADRLRALFTYDQDTGVFTRRVRSANVLAGSVAGSLSHGYMRIGVDGRQYAAHRLVILYVEGEFPPDQIDHINGVRTDNRLANLRHASNSVNGQNKRRALISNKSCGLLGASFHKGAGKWSAQIKTNGKSKHLGLFESADMAHAAYLVAKRSLHEGCTI